MSRTITELLFGVFIVVPTVVVKMAINTDGGSHDPLIHGIMCVLLFIANLIVVLIFAVVCVVGCTGDEGKDRCIWRCTVMLFVLITLVLLLFILCLLV